MTSLQRLLGIELPIIQAPMAGVQASALAIAVSNAGGLGSLPCAMLSLEAMRDEVAALRARTAEPFNVNFFCHQPPTPDAQRDAAWRTALAPYYREFGIDPATIPAGPSRAPFSHEVADVLESIRPPVVSFHFGLPSAELLSRVRSWGSKIISTATTVDEALWLQAQGVDAIIAQGLEAGGHRGMFLSRDLSTQVGTFAEHAGGHLRAAAADRGGREAADHCRGRLCGREGRGRGPGLGRGRRAGGHRLPAVS